MRLHHAKLPDVRVSYDGMGSLPSASFCHRVDLVQRLHPLGPSQWLPPFLQPGGVGARWVVRSLGQTAGAGVRPRRADRVGRGRQPLPQTGADRLRHGDAPRSLDLQPCQALDQLGARLGRGDADRPLSLLGPHQGLELAHRLSSVSQSSGPDQRQEESEGKEAEAAQAGPQPSHPAGTGGGADFPGGKLVSPAETAGQRRQPQRTRSAADRADGVGVVQPDRDLVSPGWPPSSPIPRPSVVSAEKRAVLRRHAHHPAASELAGQISRTALQKQTAEKSPCPDCRIPQSGGLTRPAAHLSTSPATKNPHPTAANPAADQRKYGLIKCETRTKACAYKFRHTFATNEILKGTDIVTLK